MNFRTTYILFGAVLAAVGVFALTQYFRMPRPGTLSAYVLPSLHKDTKTPTNPDNFDSIEIDRRRPKEEKLVFLKREHGWEMEKPYNLHVDTNQVTTLIRQVVDTRRESQSDVVKNLSYYELDQPATVVILKKGADQEWRLNIGTQGPGSGTSGVVYVTSSDRPDEPLVVRRAELDSVFKGVDDFRSKDLLEASAFNTGYVNVQEPQKEPVILDKGSDGIWRFEKPAFGDAAFKGEGTPGLGTPPNQPKRISGVQDLLEAIGAVRVESNADFGPPDASDADLAKFGLEKGKPAYLRIEIKRTAGLLGTGGEPKPPVQYALLVGNLVEAEGDKKPDDKGDKKAGDQTPKRYVRLESERAVSKIAAKNLEGIANVAANPSVLRNRDLVTITKADVDAIDIQNAAGQFKIRGKVGKPTPAKQHVQLFVGSGKPRNADDSAVQGLLDTLTKERLIKDFPDPAKEAEMGFDKPQAVVSIWVNGIKEEEKKPEDKKDEKAEDKKDKPEEKKDADAPPPLKDEKPTVKLTFGKEEKDGVYVRREIGDKKLLAVVPTTVLAKVTQGPLAYQDKNLPSFSDQADVEDIVLDRGGEVFELVKEKKDDQSPPVWKLKKPESLAGRSADADQVRRVLATVRSLRPVKLVAEGAADLDKYGLKAPQVKATVKIKAADNKTEDWVYLFGKEADDKSGVYAKQEKHDLVFVVPDDTLTTLRGELQDPTIFRFESAKVKEIKVTGWKQLQGFLITLDLERKGPNEWTVKAPPGFDLDNGQADQFIQYLSHLRAERFIVRQKGPQPQHKLGDQDAALRIEITVEGEKAPLTLTIGALDEKEKAYYAQASTVPGDVFLVSQPNFEQVLAGPKYFSKKTDGAAK
jgi:hypothetical protein